MHMTETHYMEMQQLAAIARRRGAMHPTAAGATLVLIPLFAVAGLVFLAFGDTRDTREASWAVAAETRFATPAAMPAHAGVSPPRQEAAGDSVAPTDYFPASFVNRGRDGDGDGNVMTYEHD